MLTIRSTDNTTVTVRGYFYVVDFGPDVKPRFHSVFSDGRCQCGKGKNCPAVAAVKTYRKSGGQKADRPPVGYYATLPDKCPVCGCAVFETGRVNNIRGIEWGCRKDKTHYRQHHDSINSLCQKDGARSWAFKPVAIRNGEIVKVDAILPGDTVLYEGVRRDQIGARKFPT